MILLSSDELQPGMIVARSVLGSGNNVQLAAGFVLDESIIFRCKATGLRSLWVHLEGEDVLPACNVNDQLALQAQQAWKDNAEMFKKVASVKETTLDNLTQFAADPERFKNIVASSHLKGIVESIIRSILNQEPLVLNLASIRTKDGYLYQHALDVTITAVMLASRLKFPLHDIQELAMGCFLMDLGMIIVPDAIAEKTGSLSSREAALMREHPAVGYSILRANEGISPNSAHVAYQHHERIDGSGFPRKLKGSDRFPHKSLLNEASNIHRYALIAAVADTYITAISPRPGSAPILSALDAMRLLITEAGTHLNTHVINALVALVPSFPTGTRITVTKAPKSNMIGQLGVVSKANPKDQEKPQIILLFDKYRRKIKPAIHDLALEKGFEIQFAPL